MRLVCCGGQISFWSLMCGALSMEAGDGSHVHRSSLVPWWVVGCLVFGDRWHAALLAPSLCWGLGGDDDERAVTRVSVKRRAWAVGGVSHERILRESSEI